MRKPIFLKNIARRILEKIDDSKKNLPEPAFILDKSTIGNSCKIGKGCYLFNTEIGDYTYLSTNVSMMNCVVGKFCSIAQGTCVSLGTHPSSKFVSTHPAFFSTNKQNGMTFSDSCYFEEMGKSNIGNDVWIGVNAIIMDNVNIGNGAIIGAGCVVTKDIPPYAIAVGVPAKVIRYRFKAEEIAFLEEFKWWNREEEWLKGHFKDLHDIGLFMKKHGEGLH